MWHFVFVFFCIETVFVLQYWAGVKVMLHAKKSDYENYFGKESVLLIMNHTYEIDWLIGWVLCDNCNVLGVSLATHPRRLRQTTTSNSLNNFCIELQNVCKEINSVCAYTGRRLETRRKYLFRKSMEQRQENIREQIKGIDKLRGCLLASVGCRRNPVRHGKHVTVSHEKNCIVFWFHFVFSSHIGSRRRNMKPPKLLLKNMGCRNFSITWHPGQKDSQRLYPT